MGFQVLPSIPRQMRGRGHPQCVPLQCECGEQFLWEHARGRAVSCPSCRLFLTVNDAAFDQTHNGQQL